MDAKTEAAIRAEGIKNLAKWRKRHNIPDTEWELAEAHAKERGDRLWDEWMEFFDPDGSWRRDRIRCGFPLPGKQLADDVRTEDVATEKAAPPPIRKPRPRRKK